MGVYSLKELLKSYSEKNVDNLYEPVAVGKYGIRKRSDIYKKELADDYSKNKIIYKDTLTIGLGSKQIDVGVLLDDKTYSVSPAYNTFKINTDIVNSKYLELFFLSFNKVLSDKYLIASARQGKKVDIKSMLKEEIYIPDFEEQDNIIDSVGFIYDLIEKNENLLELLDEYVDSKFNEMFGTVDNNIKSYDEINLGQYMTLLTDFNANGGYEKLDSNIKMSDKKLYAWMVRTTDLENEDFVNIKYINEDAYNMLSKTKLYGNELIMCKIGSVGKSYLMPKVEIPASLGRNAFMMRFDEDKINMRYLHYYLGTEFGRSEIEQYIRGAVTKTITKDNVRKIKLLLPPMEEQIKFESLFNNVKKIKEKLNERIEYLNEFLNMQMSLYFK